MTEDPSSALQVALAYYKAWTNKDLDQAMTYISKDIVSEAPAGRIEGAEAYRAFMSPFVQKGGLYLNQVGPVRPRDFWVKREATSGSRSGYPTVGCVLALFPTAGPGRPLRELVGALPELDGYPSVQILISSDLIAAFGDEQTALVMYDTKTVPVNSAPGAEYVTVRDGKITHSRFLFDRAPFEAARRETS